MQAREDHCINGNPSVLMGIGRRRLRGREKNLQQRRM
jgi:hypothetical protein